MQPIILCDKNNHIKLETDNYVFKGAQGKQYWPKQRGQRLGQCGIWNFLWRTGFHPLQLSIKSLPNPNNSAILFIDKLNQMDSETLSGLKKWLEHGGKIIATGELISWQSFLPTDFEWQTTSFDNAYAGLAYILNDYEPQLISPPNWNYIEHKGSSYCNDVFIGHIAAVQGERQTPSRALLNRQNNAPAIIHSGLFTYINGHPFAAFQAWLQGQEDLNPWLSWRHRLFWLDEWVSFFYDLMMKLDIIKKTSSRPGINALNRTTIILRHDLDYSRDTTFLTEENKRKIRATYALLKDRNTGFWVNQLRQFNNHEIAFHYNTGKKNWLGLLQKLFTKKNRFAFLPSNRKIARIGLLKQLKWAQRNGVDIKTIHRHLCYLIYPEWIDALDNVFDSNLNVLGSSSLFRAHVLRWGTDRIEGNDGFLGNWPDSQFPFWYPFKLAHAGKNGKILNGWEMTSLMEIEPELLIQILNHKIKHIAQNIFTLNFHPAHTMTSSIFKHGSFIQFKSLLDCIADKNIDILPMSDVLQTVNETIGVNNNVT